MDENKNCYLSVQKLNLHKKTREPEKWDLLKVKLPENFYKHVKFISAIHFNPSLNEFLLFANFYKDNENKENEDDNKCFYNDMKNILGPCCIFMQIQKNTSEFKYEFDVTMSLIKENAFVNNTTKTTKGFKIPLIAKTDEKLGNTFKSISLFLLNDVVPHNSSYFYEYNNFLYYFTYNVTIALLELKSINLDFLE